MSTTTLPKIADLYSDVPMMQKSDQLTALLNQPPNDKWVKIHPFIAGYKYLPIDKVEFLLKMIFKKYRIEITGQGTAFNGVWVTVRVHYMNPVTGDWDYHDGIGAKELQVKKGTSPADLSNINNGALMMAFPIAKTVAIKDACDHFGSLFGSDLNRKDVMQVMPDKNLQDKTVVDELNEMVEQSAPKPPEPNYTNYEVIEPEIISPPPLPPLPPDSEF